MTDKHQTGGSGPTGLSNHEKKNIQHITLKREAMKCILYNSAYKRIRTAGHMAKRKAIIQNSKLLLRFNGGTRCEESFSQLQTCTSSLRTEKENDFSVRFPCRTMTSGPLIYNYILFSWESYNYVSRRRHKMCLMTHTQARAFLYASSQF